MRKEKVKSKKEKVQTGILRAAVVSCLCLFTFTFLLLPFSFARQETAKKGYELYSWKIKNHWYYSLLPRATSSKSYAEITGSKSVQRDTSGLESELRKLPRGEEVFWMGDAPDRADNAHASRTLDLKHPSRKRIKRIKAICNKLGIRLKLA